MKGLGTFLRLLLSRAVLIGLLILAQIVLLVAGIIYLSKDFIYLYIFFIMLSVVVCVWILNNRHYTPDIKLAWIIPIAFFPVFGGLFYLIFGTFHLSASEREYLRTLNQTNRAHLPASPFLSVGAQPRAAGSADQSDALFSTAANQAGNPQTPFYAAMYKHSRYITLTSDYPSYFHTDTRYYPLGEPMWQDMLADLHKAQHFIFLEYFIIEPGAMWDSILSILLAKAAAGVEIRILYDDMGCMYTLPRGYFASLAAKGIHSKVFSPFRPRLEPAVNRRDHRKLCIIDGIYGYTGGINLADEYINVRDKHGHWKDTAIRLHGDAVRSFTVMFLQIWDFCTPRQGLSDYARYLPTLPMRDPGNPVVSPGHPAPAANAIHPHTAPSHIAEPSCAGSSTTPSAFAGEKRFALAAQDVFSAAAPAARPTACGTAAGDGRIKAIPADGADPPGTPAAPAPPTAGAYSGADNPLDRENVGESVYLGILNSAVHYVYIMTPYLIPGYEFLNALSLCAKSGVDVRIITPHIADKWFVHQMTRSHYQLLIEAGVKIYEYTPGFIHSKVFLCDDQIGTVGSVNLDYRSLRLHFENGVYLAGAACLEDIRRDFANTLGVCTPITLEECKQVALPLRIVRAFLRIIAPLM